MNESATEARSATPATASAATEAQSDTGGRYADHVLPPR